MKTNQLCVVMLLLTSCAVQAQYLQIDSTSSNGWALPEGGNLYQPSWGGTSINRSAFDQFAQAQVIGNIYGSLANATGFDLYAYCAAQHMAENSYLAAILEVDFTPLTDGTLDFTGLADAPVRISGYFTSVVFIADYISGDSGDPFSGSVQVLAGSHYQARVFTETNLEGTNQSLGGVAQVSAVFHPRVLTLEPVSLSLGLAGIGLFIRRRAKATIHR